MRDAKGALANSIQARCLRFANCEMKKRFIC